MGIRVDYGPLGFLDFPDQLGESEVLSYIQSNDADIRKRLAIRLRAPAIRELAQSETAVEAAPEGFSSGLETLGRGVAQQIGSIGQAVRAGAELERNLPGAQPMQALEKLGLGDFLRSYSATDALPRQTPTLADVGQSFDEQGILGGAREAGAFAAGNIVEQTPNILASIATGGALGLAGVPVRAATIVAPFLTTLPAETGGAFREIEERTGRADPMTAAAAIGVGGVNAALEAASDAPILGWAMNPVKRAVTAPLARSVGRVLGGAVGEGLTEAGQELVTATAPELFGAERDPNLGMRALEAGAAGAVAGGPFALAAEVQARRNEARYGTPTEGAPPVIQTDFDRAALAAQDQVAQVRQQADVAFAETAQQAALRLNQIDAQRQQTPAQTQFDANRVSAGAAAAKLNVLADLLEARSSINGAVGQAEQTAAPVVEAAVAASTQPSPTAAEPTLAPPAPGFVRMYHGGIDPTGDLNAPRDITQYLAYAKGYADKSGYPVWYVDVPENAPYMRKGFEEFEGGPKAPWINTVAPETVMRGARIVPGYDPQPTPQVQPPIPASAVDALANLEAQANPSQFPAAPRPIAADPVPDLASILPPDVMARLRAARVRDALPDAEVGLTEAVDTTTVTSPVDEAVMAKPGSTTPIIGEQATPPAPPSLPPQAPSARPSVRPDAAKARRAWDDALVAHAKQVVDVVEPLKKEVSKADIEWRTMLGDWNSTKPDAKKRQTQKAVFAKYGAANKAAFEAAYKQRVDRLQALQAKLKAEQDIAANMLSDRDLLRQDALDAADLEKEILKQDKVDQEEFDKAGALTPMQLVDLDQFRRSAATKRLGILTAARMEWLEAREQASPPVAPPAPPTPSRRRSPMAKRKALGAAGKQAKRMAAMGSDSLKDLDNLTPEEALQVAWQQGRQETRDPRATETNKTRFINFASQIDGVINESRLADDMRANDVAMTRIKDAVMREAVKSFEQAQDAGTEWTLPFAMQAAQTKIRQEANNIRRNKSFKASKTSSLTTDEGNQSDVTDDEPIPPDAMDDQGSMDEVGAMTLEQAISAAVQANGLSAVERLALYYRSVVEQKGQKDAARILKGIPTLVKELATNPDLNAKIDTIFKRDVLPKVGDLLKSIAGNLKFALSQAQVVEAITQAFGSVPESVTIIDDPNHVLPDGQSGAGVAGYIVRSTGEITLNAAYIDSPMRAVMTLAEELVHAVWPDPLVQGAWKTVLATVTQEEIDAKVAEGYAVEQAQEEVAVAKTLDYLAQNNPTPGVIENFLSTLWGKLKELFGLGTQLDQARNEILQKAFEAMREGQQTNAQDAAYMAAVERGDTATAQAMVDEAAKRAGYTIGPVFHGTQSNKRFNTFVGMWNYRFEAEKGTSYFTDNMDVAKGYGVRVIPAYLKMENPLVIDAKGEHWTIVSPSALVRARKQGNDGVIIQNVMDVPAGVPEQLATVYATFTSDAPSQIKSADPIVYDDSGAVIPLSRRFDEGSQDIRRSITSGWFVNQQTAQIAIARAQQQGADPTTIADVAQVEGELIPRSTVDTLERWSKGTPLQQRAASIARILFDVGNLASASWLAAFPVSNPLARSAADLPLTSQQLGAEAVLRASLAIDKRFDDLKQRRDAAVEELEAAILDLPKASEARNDALVAEAQGQMLLNGLEVHLANLLAASKTTPLDAQATASILEASRRVAEAKRDIGPGIGNALANIAREIPDSVVSNAAILTWIRDRMADKSQPPIMGQAVADFLINQLPGRRGLPIQQVNLSELIGELKQYRDAKALAVGEIDKFRKDTAGVTKTGKGRKVSVKTAAIRYANFREEYRNALAVARKIDNRVARATEKIEALTMALEVIDSTLQSRSYNEKLGDALKITGAIDSAIKLTTGTRGSGGIALNGTVSVGDPITGEQVILNLTPLATEVDEMIEKTFALLQHMDEYLVLPETEQDPLIAERVQRDKVRLQNMVQGWSPGYLQTMIPKWVPGLGGVTIPSLWTLYHRLPIFGKRLAAPNNIISWIGGPAGRELPPLIAARDIASISVERLRSDASGGASQSKVNLATVAAMKAHGMDTKNSASQQRIKSHFNRIISQAQDAGSTAYRVGDYNAITGLPVLAEDMEAVKAQKQLEDAVQKIARDVQPKGLTRSLFFDPLGIEEVISGRSVSRRSANYGLKMSRRANRDQVPIINRWALATTKDKKVAILREHFDTMVLGLILETSPTLALKMDPLDKQLFNSLIAMERANNLPFSDYESFLSWWASERAAETGMTEAEEMVESQDRFIGYIDKASTQYGVDHAKKAQGVSTTADLDESRNLPPAVVRALSADNQFTRPRGALHGPSTWYTHDLTGTADQEAYKGSLLNTLAMRELSGWINLRSAIGSALSTFDVRKKVLMDSGVSEGEALKRIRVESRERADTIPNEADYATLKDLSQFIDAAIAELSRIMGDTITTPADTGPVRTGRAIIGVVGSQLLMPGASMINNTVGAGLSTALVGNWLNRMRVYAAGPQYFAGMVKGLTGRVIQLAAKKNKPFREWLKTNGPVVDALNDLLADVSLKRDKANAALTVDEQDVLSLVKMIRELPTTYGVLDPGREQGILEKSLNLLQAGFGIGQLKSYLPKAYHGLIDKASILGSAAPYFLEQTKRIAPGTLDREANSTAAAIFNRMFNEPDFKQRMFAILSRRRDSVVGWNDPSSPNYRIPDEMWEGIFVVDNLKFMRDVLAPLGSLEGLMQDWFARVADRRPAIATEPFLSPEDEAAAAFELTKLTNLRTESTTPQVMKDKGSIFALWRAMLSQFGRYGANNSGVLERRMARVAGSGEKERKWLTGLALLAMFLAFSIFGMEMKGLWKDYIEREPRTSPSLGSALTDPQLGSKYLATAVASMVPYAGDQLSKMAGGTMPSNPFDITRSIPVLGIGTQVYKSLTTALQTGDAVYPMVDLARVAFPATKPVLNRFMEGDAARREAYRGVRANAPGDIEMREFSGGGGRATPMQPLIRSAINAYMEGDMDGYQAAYRKAVEYQVGTGKDAKAADRAVRSALASKDPIMSSVGRTLPDEDVERITQRLSSRQKNAFLRARSLTSSLRKGRGSKRTSPLRKRRQKAKRRTRRQA